MPIIRGKDMPINEQKIDSLLSFIKDKYLMVGRDDNAIMSLFGKQFGVLTKEELENEPLTDNEAGHCTISGIGDYVILEWDL